MLIRVDLPAPFSPTRAWISPWLRSKLTPSRALTPGKVLVMLFISSSERSIFKIAFTAKTLVPPQSKHCKLKIEKCKLQITSIVRKDSPALRLLLQTIFNLQLLLTIVSATDPSAHSYKRLPTCGSRLY